MKYIVKYTRDHFCISTLALLNGDLDFMARGFKGGTYYFTDKNETLELKDIYVEIIGFIESELSQMGHNFKIRKIKKEYKRVLKIYKNRLDVLIGIK
jgi:hypothetical protein